MPAQEWGHILVIVFILLGNIGYYVMKMSRKTAA
jgi:uncharacterized membrane protein